MESYDVGSFISDTSKFGVKGVKKFVKVFVIFFVINIIAIIVALYYKIFMPALYGFLIAVLFTSLALYITYKSVFKLSVAHFYQYASPLFKKVSDSLVEKCMDVPVSELQTKNQAISKAVDVGKIVTETYGKKVPKAGKKAIAYMVNRIPIVPIITELKDETGNFENREEVKDLAYLKIDAYIKKEILGTKPAMVYIVLLINIVIQIVVIFYFVQKAGVVG